MPLSWLDALAGKKKAKPKSKLSSKLRKGAKKAAKAKTSAKKQKSAQRRRHRSSESGRASLSRRESARNIFRGETERGGEPLLADLREKEIADICRAACRDSETLHACMQEVRTAVPRGSTLESTAADLDRYALAAAGACPGGPGGYPIVDPGRRSLTLEEHNIWPALAAPEGA